MELDYFGNPEHEAARVKVLGHFLKGHPASLDRRTVAAICADMMPTEYQALRLRNVLASTSTHTRINERASIAAFMAKNATMIEDREGNVRPAVYVSVWQRDCDMCEWTYVTSIGASVRAYNNFHDSIGDGAEGPFSIGLLTVKEAEAERDFLTESRGGRNERDLVLEAFEDGHPHCVYA